MNSVIFLTFCQCFCPHSLTFRVPSCCWFTSRNSLWPRGWAGPVLQGVAQLRLHFLGSGFMITKLLGLQEMRNQGRERVSTRECCPCLSSALPLPPSWWNGCGETPSCSLQCEMGDVASVGLSQSLRTPVITFVSFDCLPVTFFSKSSASFQGLGLL